MRLRSHEFVTLLQSLIKEVENGHYLSGCVHFEATDESSASLVTYTVRQEDGTLIKLKWWV